MKLRPLFYRICKTSQDDGGRNYNLISRSENDSLKIALIKTLKKYDNGQLLEIPEHHHKLINWKTFYPLEDKLPIFEETKNISILKSLESGILLFDQDYKIFLVTRDKCLPGFIYMKKFMTLNYEEKSLPKLHLSFNCNYIKSQILFSVLDNKVDDYKFTFTNTLINDVEDRETEKIIQNQRLQICKDCKFELESETEIIESIKNFKLSRLKLHSSQENYR